MKLTPVFLDFESYWDKDHTLSKMSPIEYVMSPKTEIISVAIKVGDYPTDVIFGEDKIRHVLNKLDWSNKMAIGHNMSGFDSMILKWRFGIQPAMWGCTAAMARPKYAKTTGVSLKALAKEFGIGAKLDLEATNTKGKYLKDFTPEELDAMSEYNKVDIELCAALFKRLVKGFPKNEMVLIHLTTQMLVNPKFVLDKGLLEVALSTERSEKHKALLELAKLLRSDSIDIDWSDEAAVAEFVRSEMASAPRFAKLLESCGVEVPMKPSPTDPTKQVPALAKTDEGFLKLQDHPNPLVASAARTRLSVKSTILETRLEAFLRAGAACGGKLPVPLKYCGADTTGRWSGEQYNCQNLPRIGSKPKTSDALRNSLKAPKGHKVVVADLSGIELRVNHFLWKVQSSMDLYAEDAEADLYRAFAAVRYGITPAEVSKDQRQLAKLCLAEGTLVLTDRGEVPIEQVTASDKVWDGVEWVSTLGPVFKGVKDVIEYDGLVATPDHEVWVEDGRKVPLRYAATQSLRLARTGDAWVPLGFGGTGVERDAEVEGVSGGTDTLHELRHSEVGQLRQPSSWPDAGLPTVPAEVRGTCVALAEDGSREATLHQPERRGLQAVRRSGYSVPVPVGGGGRSVGDDQPWPAPGQGAGPHRQQRPLRAGKLAVGKPQAECSQSRAQQVENLSPVSGDAPGGSLCGQHPAKPAEQGADVRGDCGSVEPSIRQTQRRVWDLLNCGPRHRFTANGRLVSNCQLGLGFGAGAATFRKVAKLMGGLELSESEAKDVVDSWRATYHDIVQGWRRCHDALPDILQGTSKLIDPWGMCETELGAIRLPSGRRIYYPALRTEVGANGKKEWWYGEGRHKARIYAGKITENCLAEGTLVLTDSGWKPIEMVSLDDRVHDGIEFVNHAGVVFKSVQPCITLDGVYMTPDHEVLTNGGWKEASQVQRHYRPDLRGVRSVGGHPSVERGYWDQSQHALQPPEIGLVSGGANSPTLARKPVYDILNCGPRHRFVVKGLDGPMVVHNCVQALARDVIAGNAIDFWRATRFEPVLMVHDELVFVVPEADAQGALDELQKIMRTPPKWWPELVTWSEGDIADSYGAAK